MTIIMALALTGEARGQAQWQTVTGPDGSFTVEMPGAASYEPVAQKSTQGTPYTLHQYLFPQGHSTLYIAQTAVYPQDENMSDGKAALQALLTNYAKGLDQVKWISVDWVKHQRLNAVAAYGTTAGGEDQRSFAVIKGQQLFDLEYFGPLGTGKSADVDRFISSLRIGGGGPQRASPLMESIPSRRDRP